MDRNSQINAGDHVVDTRFFDEHPDTLMYMRWATMAECALQEHPLGTAIIALRRSLTDPN